MALPDIRDVVSAAEKHPVATMNGEMARYLVGQINQKAREISAMLIALREQEGWRALGYQSWTAFLESDELEYSRNRCLDFIRAFPALTSVRQELHIELKTEQALALSRFDAPYQVMIAETALSVSKTLQKPLSAGMIQRAGEVMMQAVKRGVSDIGNGESTPIIAALTLEEVEATKRQKQYIVEKAQVFSTEATVDSQQPRGNKFILVLELDEPLEVEIGQTVKVRAA